MSAGIITLIMPNKIALIMMGVGILSERNPNAMGLL